MKRDSLVPQPLEAQGPSQVFPDDGTLAPNIERYVRTDRTNIRISPASYLIKFIDAKQSPNQTFCNGSPMPPAPAHFVCKYCLPQ